MDSYQVSYILLTVFDNNHESLAFPVSPTSNTINYALACRRNDYGRNRRSPLAQLGKCRVPLCTGQQGPGKNRPDLVLGVSFSPWPFELTVA